MTSEGTPKSRTNNRAIFNFGSVSLDDFRPRRDDQTKDPPHAFKNGQRIGFDGVDVLEIRIGRMELFEHFYLPKITN